MYHNFLKKQTIKQLVRYVLPIYLSLIILGFMAYITSYTVTLDNSNMFTGLAMLGHYLIWIIFIIIVTIVLSSILTVKNIKNNYNDNSKSNYTAFISNILKTFLVYMIVTQLINGIISLTISDDSIEFVINIIKKLILIPIIVPIAKYFNKDNYVSRKTIKNFYLFCVAITIIFCLIRGCLFAIYIPFGPSFIDLYIFFVFIIPNLIIGLQNNVKKAKNVNEKKELIIILALLLVLLAIILGINSIGKIEISNTDW